MYDVRDIEPFWANLYMIFLLSHVARCARTARIHVWALCLCIWTLRNARSNGIYKYFVCAISKIANPSQHHYIDFDFSLWRSNYRLSRFIAAQMNDWNEFLTLITIMKCVSSAATIEL